MKICLINQPAGIGDIMYVIQIGRFFADKGYRVIWPVIKQYQWLSRYIDCDNQINFLVEDDDFPMKDLYLSSHTDIVFARDGLYVPLRKSTVSSLGSRYPLMLSKYAMVGLTGRSKRWHTAFNINRDQMGEKKVQEYYDYRSSQDFVFCNTLIGSPDGHMMPLQDMRDTVSSIRARSKYLRILENEFVKDTTLFDFIGILSSARELHLPNSALAWIAEYLAVKNISREDQRRFCYPRDRGNPINDNWNYLKGCWNEENWFLTPPKRISRGQ